MTTPKKLSVLLFVALAAPSVLAITATKDYVDRRDNIVSNALASALQDETARAKNAESANASAISQTASDLATETTRAKAAESEIKSLADSHISDTNNPHGVTALQVGALPAVYSNGNYYVTDKINARTIELSGKLWHNDGRYLTTYVTSDKLSSYVPITRTINSKQLNNNITLTASDVGAYAKADTYTKTEVDSKVSTAVSVETTRAKNAEQTLTTALNAETARAKNAEAEIKSLANANASAISAETTRAKAAESANATAIANETTRATKAEAEIKSLANSNATAISSETTRATKAEAEIKSLANSHISDTNNPHGVTALQVGALPAVYSNNQYNVTNDINLKYAYVTGDLYRKRTFSAGFALSRYLSSDELTNQYVARYQTINGHSLSNRNIIVTASDVGAYAKADTYTKTEVDSKVAAAAPADYANVSNLAYTAVQSRFAGVNFIDTTNTFFSSKSNPGLGFLLEDYVNEVESDPTVSAWAKAETKPTYTASEVGAVPTTRKVNSKPLSSDITLSASDVGAYAKADTYTKSEVYTKTEAAAQFYPKTEGELWESWWSGDGFRVSVTNYNVEVTDSTAWERLPTASFDYKPDATATAYTAVWNENTKWDRWLNLFNTYTNATAASLDNKADRAWGNYDSTTGLEAPEGYTWISSEHVALSAGLAYQKFITTGGAVWVLTSNGLTTETSGVASNAFFRVADDTGKALFEIVKGDKVTVGANVDGITVDNNANSITVTISYPVESTEHPTVEATASLTNILWQTSSECYGAWTESWSGSSGAWTNTITMTQSPPCYFFRAYYQKGGDTYINNSAPVALQKVVLGGVTYSITVEEVNGKKLMVLTEAN